MKHGRAITVATPLLIAVFARLHRDRPAIAGVAGPLALALSSLRG